MVGWFVGSGNFKVYAIVANQRLGYTLSPVTAAGTTQGVGGGFDLAAATPLLLRPPLQKKGRVMQLYCYRNLVRNK